MLKVWILKVPSYWADRNIVTHLVTELGTWSFEAMKHETLITWSIKCVITWWSINASLLDEALKASPLDEALKASPLDKALNTSSLEKH
jgi:hypothetical protein